MSIYKTLDRTQYSTLGEVDGLLSGTICHNGNCTARTLVSVLHEEIVLLYVYMGDGVSYRGIKNRTNKL